MNASLRSAGSGVFRLRRWRRPSGGVQDFKMRNQHVRKLGMCFSKEEDNRAFESGEGAKMASDLKEIASLDKLIDLLMSAKSRDEVH